MNNLMKKYEENNLKIKELNKKIKLLNSNSIEVKLTFGIIFAIIPWLVLVFLDPTLVKFIPLNLIQPLTIIVPTLIGFVGEHLFQKKFKFKENLTKFSKSKTEKERDKEVIFYEIEREKLINYNKILSKINANSSLMDSLPNNYKNKEDLNLNINRLNNILKENKKKIDILSCKNVLKINFIRIRDKLQNIIDQIGFTFIGGFFFMFLYYLPILSINNFSHNLNIELSIFEVLSPFLFGSLIVGSYFYKIRRDEKSVFRFFNSKLGKYALSDKINDNYKEDFKLELENIISESCIAKLELDKLTKDKEETKVIETPTYQEDNKEIIREEKVKVKVKKLGSRYDIH